MDKAFSYRPGKRTLMTFARHRQHCGQPRKLMISRARPWLLSLMGLFVLTFLSFHSNIALSSPNGANAEQTRSEKQAARAERKRQRQLQRQAKQEARQQRKQAKKIKRLERQQAKLQKQKRVQTKGNTTVIKLNKNTKVKIKPQGDTTKVVVVKKKNNNSTHSHTSTIEQITDLVSNGGDSKTIRKTVDSITPDKYPRHAKTGPKTVIKFDEHGLIGYKMKNQQATLKQPLEKSSLVNNLESKYGELDKVKVKNNARKTRVVAVFKAPVNQHPAVTPATPAVTPSVPVTTPQAPVVSHPADVPLPPTTPSAPSVVAEPIATPVVVNTPVPPSSPIIEPVLPVTEPAPSTPGTPVVNAPSTPTTTPVTNIPATPVNAPVTVPTPNIPTTVAQQPVIQPAPPVAQNPVVEPPVITASINQRIEGTPTGSEVSQPLSVLNLGGSSSPANPQAAAPGLQFNARVADNADNLADEAGQESSLGDMPVHRISYLDTSGYRQQSSLFSTTGTGISLRASQCEELDGCAPAGSELKEQRITAQGKENSQEVAVGLIPDTNAGVVLRIADEEAEAMGSQTYEEPIDYSVFADADLTIEDDEEF